MGDTRHTCTVDEVTSVSEVYVTFMLRTWRFGGVMGDTRPAHTVG